MPDLRATIAAFNDLDCGYTITLGAAQQLRLTQSDLSEIAAFTRRWREWDEAMHLRTRGRSLASDPPAPKLPTCLSRPLSRGKAPAHV